MELNALDLSRLQFAFTVSFHIIFPAMSIGLASFIAVLEGAWLKTGKVHYKALCIYWSKVFAVGFGMGVVSGVVMAYQFGTNWARFSAFAGPVTGPLLTYEVMTAFFLEAGFLGVMLFGWEKVGRAAHFGATVLVAIGTLISTFWILASNSWMQTPQGFVVSNSHVVPVDWFKIIFNPSFPYRLAHMSIAAFIVAALLVSGTGGWHLLKGRRDSMIKTMFSMALWLLLILAPVQVLVGDQHGLNTRKYQPAKIAAIEGLWETEKGGTALNLIGLPDMNDEVTKYAIKLPHLGSVILTHTWEGEIKGLKEFPKEDRPDSSIIFWTFRLMAGLGMLMVLLAVIGLLLRRGGRIFENRFFQRFAVAMGPAGFVALIAGWVTTEVGRQPFVVYGYLRTDQAVSPVASQSASISLMIFVLVYCVVFGTGIYYIFKLLVAGPSVEALPISAPGLRAAASSGRRPMAAVD